MSRMRDLRANCKRPIPFFRYFRENIELDLFFVMDRLLVDCRRHPHFSWSQLHSVNAKIFGLDLDNL